MPGWSWAQPGFSLGLGDLGSAEWEGPLGAPWQIELPASSLPLATLLPVQFLHCPWTLTS